MIMEIKELFESCIEFMTNHLNTVEVPDLPESERKYRIEHSMRVAKYAIQIAENEGYDLMICALAAILHDVGKFESSNKDHGRMSARISKEFLPTLGLDEKQVNDICYCIACHCDKRDDYNYGPIPEEVVIRDADNIDRYGVYRIIQALHYDGFDEMNLQEKLEFCKNKIIDLENRILSKCNTETGTKLFQQACNIQLDYFRMLKEELNFTLLETDISKLVLTTNSNYMS
jgi:uncharacterized protein